MSAQTINFDSMIRGAFTRCELEALEAFPAFVGGLLRVSTVDEFEVLCWVGHELLLMKADEFCFSAP